MTDDQNEHPPGEGTFESGGVERPGMSPPVEQTAGFDEGESRSRWPTVVGIIGIVFASFGLVCSCAGFFGSKFQEFAANQMAQSGNSDPAFDAQLQAAQEYQISSFFLSGVGVVLAGLLLASAIAMTMRKPWCRPSAIAWSVLKILYAAGAVGVQLMVASRTADILIEKGESASASAGNTLAMIMSGLFMLWFCVLPVFFLIWFTRGKIRTEVEGWRTAERDLI